MSNSSGLWFYNLVQSNTAYTRALNSSILLADATKPSQTFSSLRNVGSGGEEYDLFFDSVDVGMTFNTDNVYFSGKEYAKFSLLQTKFEDTNSIDFVINVDLDPDQVGLQTLVSRDESFTIFLDDGIPVFESTSTRSLITDTENDKIRERKGVFVYNATEAFTGSWLRVRSSWSETGTVVEFFQSDDGVSYSQIGTNITSNALDMYFGGSTITVAADTGGFNSTAGKFYKFEVTMSNPVLTINFTDAEPNNPWFYTEGNLVEFVLQSKDFTDPVYLEKRDNPYLFFPKGFGRTFSNAKIPQSFYESDTCDIRVAFIIPEHASNWNADLISLNAFKLCIDNGAVCVQGDAYMKGDQTFDDLGYKKGEPLGARLFYNKKTKMLSLFVGKPSESASDLESYIWVGIGNTKLKRASQVYDTITIGSRNTTKENDLIILNASLSGVDIDKENVINEIKSSFTTLVDRSMVLLDKSSKLKSNLSDVDFADGFSLMINIKSVSQPTSLPEVSKMENGVGWSLGIGETMTPVLIVSDGNKTVTVRGSKLQEGENVLSVVLDRENEVATLYNNGLKYGMGSLEGVGSIANNSKMFIGDNDFELYNFGMWDYMLTDEEVKGMSQHLKSMTNYANNAEFGLWHVGIPDLTVV